MRIFAGVLIFLVIVFFASLGLSTCNTALKMNNNLQETVYEEFKPEELLRKYEWFKDASASLDQKLATLSTYETRFDEIKKGYGKDSTSRAKWVREDREQYNIWLSEYTGVKASYNDLASEYNSAMAKFNYRFTNAGDLPKGADRPVQREYKEYLR